MRRVIPIWFFAALLPLAACQSHGISADPDGSDGADAGQDGGSDPGSDVGADQGADAGGEADADMQPFVVDDPSAQVRLEPVEEYQERVVFAVVMHNLGRVHSLAMRIQADPLQLSFEGAEDLGGLPAPAEVMVSPFDSGELWFGGALVGIRDVDTSGEVTVARLSFVKTGSGPTQVGILPHGRGVMDGRAVWQPASWSGASRGGKAGSGSRAAYSLPQAAGLSLAQNRPALLRPDVWMTPPPVGTRQAYELDVEFVSAEVVLDPADLQMTVAATYTISVTAGSTDLAGFLLLDQFGPIQPQAEVDQTSVAPTVTQVPSPDYLHIELPLPRIYNQGEQLEVRLVYSGVPDCQVPMYPLPIGACQVTDDSIAFHFGTFLPHATGVKPLPAVEIFDAELTVTMPAAYKVGATGALTQSTDNQDGTWSHLFQSSSVKRLLFAASTGYFEATESLEGRPIRVLGYTPAEVAVAAPLIKEILASHSQRRGEYLYDGIHVTELPLNEVGVGSAAGIFVTNGALGPGDWNVRHLAHELGHQWIAGMLPVDTNSSFYLQEGLTELTAFQFLSEWSLQTYGTDVSLSMHEQNLLSYTLGVDPQEDIPMATYLPDIPHHLFHTLCYLKSQGVLRTLKTIIGADLHQDVVRSLIADHLFTLALTTDSYKQAVEASSGLDLQGFFDEWIHGTGYPRYQLSYQAAPASAGRYQVDFELSSDDDFHLPIALKFMGPEGQETTEILQAAPGVVSASLELTFCPDVYQLDPEVNVVHLSQAHPAGDVYRDGDVDGFDLAYASIFFGGQVLVSPYHSYVDFDLDGDIDDTDLQTVKTSFGSAQSCKGK